MFAKAIALPMWFLYTVFLDPVYQLHYFSSIQDNINQKMCWIFNTSCIKKRNSTPTAYNDQIRGADHFLTQHKYDMVLLAHLITIRIKYLARKQNNTTRFLGYEHSCKNLFYVILVSHMREATHGSDSYWFFLLLLKKMSISWFKTAMYLHPICDLLIISRL